MARFSSADELKNQLRQLKTELQSTWPIESLALFGSWGRGDARPDSDVDLLISFKQGKGIKRLGLFDFFTIKLSLEKALGCKVDLVEKQALKPNLANYILPEAEEL